MRTSTQITLVLLGLAIVLGVPFIFRPDSATPDPDARPLVIITPHNEQIRHEFSIAFDRWYRAQPGGGPVVIDWRTPGGTAEIRRQLFAEYQAALRRGPIPQRSMSYDLLFGGGSYEHTQMAYDRTARLTALTALTLPPGTAVVPARVAGDMPTATLPAQSVLKLPDGTTITLSSDTHFTGPAMPQEFAPFTLEAAITVDLPRGSAISATVSIPVAFSADTLDEWYGSNKIGRNYLYHPDLYWFGTALSTFGIVFNKELFAVMGVAAPTTWADLGDPRLQGWIALGDPAASGSICTAYEVILQRQGWAQGWQTLRRGAANSRYFANSSSKIPVDVSLGDAAAGMCIDFYGRYQAQSVTDDAGNSRIAYVDPIGLTDVDPDPISMLRGARHPELARAFIEFCLTDEAQALWQFPVRRKQDDAPQDALGPVRFELRRMPAKRSMYEMYSSRFVDRDTNPFRLAAQGGDSQSWDSNLRRYIAPLFSAMAIDNHRFLVDAWKALNRTPVTHPQYQRMHSLFYQMPRAVIDFSVDPEEARRGEQELAGKRLLLEALVDRLGIQPPLFDEQRRNWYYPLDSPAYLDDLKQVWRDDPKRRDWERIRWARFFRDNYRRIIQLADGAESNHANEG